LLDLELEQTSNFFLFFNNLALRFSKLKLIRSQGISLYIEFLIPWQIKEINKK